jgi:hypothetical protein
MKNKFMTKALAVVLSASMALSLSSATALTANAAAAPKLAKKTVSVKAGKKAKNKLKAASYKAGWRITKATVKKTAVAKAKVKKNKKVVVVTGVKKGATKIVLALKNAKTGAAKKLKFKAKVKVDAPVIVEPVDETASVTAATQKTFDSVVLTFDKEIDATAVSIETVAINGSVGAATSVTIGDDKKSATVVYGYAENTEYTFSVNNLGGTATVKVGSYAVTDIQIENQSVETGSDQDIKYALVAGDVDVTKYNNYTDYVTFDFDGDQTSYSADPVKPTIYFSERDQKSTVTVKYNNGVDAEISKTITVTSVAATATAAEARFAENLMKWYLVDTTSETFNITPEGDAKQVVFYAKDKDGKAVKFDDVEVTSSNENVATVSWSQNAAGKYYILSVEPAGNAGNAKMTVKTTEYKGTEEVHSEYTFDVASKEFNNNLYSVEAGASSVSLYNSPYAPSTKVAMKPVNSLGEAVSTTWDITITKGKDDSDEVRAWRVDDNDNPDENGNNIHIDALGATAGTYKVAIVISGESGNNTKDITKNVNVRVTDALDSVIAGDWAVSGDTILGVSEETISATYKVEVKDLKITDYQGMDDSTDVKLAVYVGGKPVGYMRTWGVDKYSAGWAIGQTVLQKTMDTTEAIDFNGLNAYVYSGSKYFDDVVGTSLYLGNNGTDKNDQNFGKKDEAESGNTIKVGGSVKIYAESGNTASEVYYYGDGNNKNNVAAAGAYNVVVKYGKNFTDGKQLGNAGKFNVTYSLTMPTVEYNLSEQAEVKVKSNVDLVRAEDGYSVTYASNAGTKDVGVLKYNSAIEGGYDFRTAGLSKGYKIYAVCVDDVRGGWSWNGKENGASSWSMGRPGDTAVVGKYAFNGGDYQGGVLIHFVIEKTSKITA